MNVSASQLCQSQENRPTYCEIEQTQIISAPQSIYPGHSDHLDNRWGCSHICAKDAEAHPDDLNDNLHIRQKLSTRSLGADHHSGWPCAFIDRRYFYDDRWDVRLYDRHRVLPHCSYPLLCGIRNWIASSAIQQDQPNNKSGNLHWAYNSMYFQCS